MSSTATPPVSPECLAIANLFEDHAFCLLDQSPSSTFRALDWRWIVARSQVRTGSRARPRWIDGPVKRAVSYLHQEALAATSGRSKRRKDEPAIAGAVALRSCPSNTVRTAIEALLLAGLDDHEIAIMVGTDEDVIAAYHDVFYDVRPILAHSDVVMERVFGRRIYIGVLDASDAVRLLSFQGGQHVARGLVAAVVLPRETEGQDDHQEVAELFGQYLLAANLPTDARSIPALLGLNAQASQLAHAREDRTVASVTKPLTIGNLDVSMMTDLADSVRVTGPIEPSGGLPVCAESTPWVNEVGPDEVKGAVSEGEFDVEIRLGIAG